MKCMMFYGPEKGLEIAEVPDPELSRTDLLVKVEACGLCHTDLHYIEHGVPTFKKPPLILGHEAAGVVEDAGPACGSFKPGDHVLIPSVMPCGNCYNCASGRGNICSAMKMPGNHVDGGFAQYMKIREWHAIRLPDTLGFAEASTIADAVSTAYHAVVNRAKVEPGRKVVVVGCGGVGINVVQVSSLVGAEVTAIDSSDKKLALAKEFGATSTINPADEKSVKQLRGSVDISFECVGNPKTINLAHSLIKPGGSLIIVGYSSEPATMAAHRIMFNEQQVFGSLGCRLSSFYEVVRLASEGKLNLSGLVSGVYGLDALPEAINNLKRGYGLRHVIEPWK